MIPFYPELEQKIMILEQLLPKVHDLKSKDKMIVTNNGTYDILHLGHVLGLLEAKKQGDVLIVGVNSDRSVRAYKGESRPIITEDQRIRMLAALACVDYVFLFDDPTPNRWLAEMKPHVHTNGAEYGENCIERSVVEENGGKIYLLPMIAGCKTSDLIQKIKGLM